MGIWGNDIKSTKKIPNYFTIKNYFNSLTFNIDGWNCKKKENKTKKNDLK